jgi:hypothetical protein
MEISPKKPKIGSSVTEHLPGTGRELGSIPRTTSKQNSSCIASKSCS